MRICRKVLSQMIAGNWRTFGQVVIPKCRKCRFQCANGGRPGRAGRRPPKVWLTAVNFLVPGLFASKDLNASRLRASSFSYVSDQPSRVSANNTASVPKLTSDSVFPWPSKRSRVSDLRHKITATTSTAHHEIAHGKPGYPDSAAIVLSEGWPAGSHQGRTGAKPAANTNVRILRLIQPLIFGMGLFFRILRHTKNSHASNAAANGSHP